MTTTPQAVQIVCDNKCGFRVHEFYFRDKQRFFPGTCPNCYQGIPIVVFENTRDPVPGSTIVLATVPGGPRAGTVLR